MSRTGHYRKPDQREVLDKMGAARYIASRYLPSHPEYEAARAVLEAIDRFAELTTGDAQYYWAKPHTIP